MAAMLPSSSYIKTRAETCQKPGFEVPAYGLMP
jgi:hypothetical protein